MIIFITMFNKNTRIIKSKIGSVLLFLFKELKKK